MGIDANAQNDPENDFVQATHAAGAAFAVRISNPLYTLDFLWNLSSHGRKYNRDLKTIHDFTAKVSLLAQVCFD